MVSGAKGAYTPLVIAGPFAFISGQGGLLPDGTLAPGGIAGETIATLQNVERILREINATAADLVAVTCYLTDLSEWDEMDAAYRRFFGDRPLPTRTAVGVAALPFGIRLEMTATAYVPAVGTGAAG